jgi:ribonuclease H / adenosylcobalamin/alpha-ribazole phosphatase
VIEKLILVRHGETVHNVAGIAQGWNDSALSPRGEEQAARLAQRIAAQKVDAIISSPLGRARATAEVIARACGLEVTTLDELREMNYGGWEGRSFLDVRRDDAAIYEEWIVDGDCPCPGGESHNDVRRRFAAALEKIQAARPVLVTHGTAIRIGVTVLLDLPVMASRHFAQDNAALNVFLWRADRWVMKLWNDSE